VLEYICYYNYSIIIQHTCVISKKLNPF
jgi:hypothetical protein